MKIYVDLDDVLACTIEGFLELLRDGFSHDIPYDRITSFDLECSLPLSSGQYEEFMRRAHAEPILMNLRPVPEARDVLADWASRGAEIVVVTGRPSTAAAVSKQWLQANTMPVHSLLLVAKYRHSTALSDDNSSHNLPLSILSQMRFTFAIEDSPRMSEYLAEVANIPVLMLDRPWNRVPPRQASHAPITRMNSWADIRREAEAFWK